MKNYILLNLVFCMGMLVLFYLSIDSWMIWVSFVVLWFMCEYSLGRYFTYK